jgi:hypothetical protein
MGYLLAWRRGSWAAQAVDVLSERGLFVRGEKGRSKQYNGTVHNMCFGGRVKRSNR